MEKTWRRLIVWFPTINYVEALYHDQIKSGNLINRNGLISTLDKVRWGIPFQDVPTIWDRVTILYKEIIDHHYFSDGNKRIGSLLAYIFLNKNGYEFNPTTGEIYKITMQVAKGLKEFDEIKEWFKSNSIKS